MYCILINCFLLTALATKEFIDTSLRKMVYQMADDIYVLPSSVCMLLKIVQENCHAKNIKTPHKCAALKVSIVILRNNYGDDLELDIKLIRNHHHHHHCHHHQNYGQFYAGICDEMKSVRNACMNLYIKNVCFNIMHYLLLREHCKFFFNLYNTLYYRKLYAHIRTLIFQGPTVLG